MRPFNLALAGAVTIAFGSSALAQQQREGSYTPSEAEVLALVTCEEVVLGKQNLDARIRSGIYDRLYGQWLIVGEKRDEVISCLVGRHGWAAVSTPDRQRVARAPR